MYLNQHILNFKGIELYQMFICCRTILDITDWPSRQEVVTEGTLTRINAGLPGGPGAINFEATTKGNIIICLTDMWIT